MAVCVGSSRFQPVEIINSSVESNCFSTIQTKENFSSTVLNCHLLVNAENSSKCVSLLKGGLWFQNILIHCCDTELQHNGKRRQAWDPFMNATVTPVSFLVGFDSTLPHFVLYCRCFIPALMPALTFTLKLLVLLDFTSANCQNYEAIWPAISHVWYVISWSTTVVNFNDVQIID